MSNIAASNVVGSRGNGPGQQTPEAIGRRLLEIVVYDKCCRVGGKLTLDDLVETSEVGDWKMPDFKAACSYAASQGWLIVRDDGGPRGSRGVSCGLCQRRRTYGLITRV